MTVLRVRYQFGLQKVMALSIAFIVQQKMARVTLYIRYQYYISVLPFKGDGNFQRALGKAKVV